MKEGKAGAPPFFRKGESDGKTLSVVSEVPQPDELL